jgi:hypothetical protein
LTVKDESPSQWSGARTGDHEIDEVETKLQFQIQKKLFAFISNSILTKTWFTKHFIVLTYKDNIQQEILITIVITWQMLELALQTDILQLPAPAVSLSR